MIATTHPDSDVVSILSRFDERERTEKTVLKQASQAPERFHLTLLLVMIWAVLLLWLSPMLIVRLLDPVALIRNEHSLLFYSFQIPMAVFAAGILGRRYGTLAILCYLLLGFAGLPFFAGGGGLDYFAQPSSGYLIGFLLLPYAIQPFLNKAYCNAGWFRGRSFWMALGAIVGIFAVHLTGLAGIGIHLLRGAETLEQARIWIEYLSWPTLVYDFLFSWIAIASVRISRLLLWFCLY